MILRLITLVLATTLLCAQPSRAWADGEPPYPTYEGITDEGIPTSPKEPWGEFTVTEDHGGSPWWSKALLWIPNRVLDLIDVFRVDVGVGPAAGGVIRFTELGQVGYRQMMPFSLRVGAFGRQFPGIVETSNEIGAGPAFIASKDREVCGGEIGLGADLFIAGAYAGFCVEELADFVTGIFFIDIMDDDIDPEG